MKYAEFVEGKKKSGQAILDSLTPQRASIAHMLAGVQDELMELSAAIDKQDTVNVREEVGDLLFYLVGLALDYDLEIYPEAHDNPVALEDLITLVKRDIYYEKETDINLVQRLISNVIYDFHNIIEGAGWTVEEILQENMDKLDKRYAKGYSNESANERADKVVD